MKAWSRHRVLGVDAARGVALLGMMAVHIVPPVRENGAVSPAFLLAAGRSAALFAVVAGVGLALLTRWTARTTARQRAQHRVAVLIRALLITAIGLLLSAPDSGVAVILVYYGVLFALAVPFLGLQPATLAAWSACTAVVVPVISHLVRPHLVPASYQVPDLSFYDRPPWDWLTELTLTGYYPALPWIAYLFAGMAVGKLTLADRAVAVRLLVGGTLLALGARVTSWLLLYPLGGLDQLAEQHPQLYRLPLRDALAVGLYGTTPTDSWWWLVVASPHTSTPFDMATTIGSSLAVLGLCLLVLPHPRRWATPLVALGGMPLTLYSLHVVLLGGPLPRTTPHAYLWHVLAITTVALLWRHFIGQGPLEYLTQQASRRLSRALVPTLPPATAAPSAPDNT